MVKKWATSGQNLLTPAQLTFNLSLERIYNNSIKMQNPISVATVGITNQLEAKKWKIAMRKFFT